jgi:hypothetical protein
LFNNLDYILNLNALHVYMHQHYLDHDYDFQEKVSYYPLYEIFITYLTYKPKHLSLLVMNSSPGFCNVRVARSSVFCVCFVDRCLSFWPFRHCVLLRFTVSNDPFDLRYIEALLILQTRMFTVNLSWLLFTLNTSGTYATKSCHYHIVGKLLKMARLSSSINWPSQATSSI